MQSQEFRNFAIESSQLYLDFFERTGKGRSIINPIRLEYTGDSVRFYLSAQLPSADSVLIRIHKEDCPSSIIRLSYFDPELRCLHLTPKPEYRKLFSNLNCHDVEIVSDMRFLVRNVQSWYNNNPFVLPSELPYPDDIDICCNDNNLTEEQLDAVFECMRNSLAYVWGVPGSGKTSLVLSTLVLSYVSAGLPVLIVAPTNNALEQTMKTIIPTLELAGYSHDIVLRLGMPSRNFIAEFPDVCEAVDVQRRIERLTEQLAEVTKALSYFSFEENYKTVKAFLHSAYDDMSSYISEKQQLRKIIESRCEDRKIISSKLAFMKDKQKILRAGLINAQSNYSQLLQSKTSALFRFSCLLGLRSSDELDTVIDEKSAYIQNCIDELENVDAEIEKLSSELSNVNTNIDNLKYSYSDFAAGQSILSEAENLSEFYTPLKKAIAAINCNNFLDDFAFIQEQLEFIENIISEKRDKYAQFMGMSSDELNQLKYSLESEIKTYSPESTENRIKNCLVLGATIDACIKRIDSDLYKPRHVFLDEAAYCPLIKAGILTSFSAPLTLLGDHMQLPPVCEVNDSSLNIHGNESLVLWMQSSIYLDSAECLSMQELRMQYSGNEPPHFSVMHLAFLSRTFRYGVELAKILAKYVYVREVVGNSEYGTELEFVDIGHKLESGNSNEAEAEAISEYFASHINEDIAILTPYKDQVRMLMSKYLPRDRIFTVHKSQGQEWDTVILSVVTERPRWFTDSNLAIGKKLLNTAVSRARKKLIIVLDWSEWQKYGGQLITELCNS